MALKTSNTGAGKSRYTVVKLYVKLRVYSYITYSIIHLCYFDWNM